MPEENYAFSPREALMQAGEIVQIAQAFVRLGVNKIRLTGGEPLIRKDADTIIRSLSRLPVQLALTTNGVRLHHFADVFKETGLSSVNISLDTLQADKFQLITRRDSFRRVLDNIGMMVDSGIHVKINVVVMAGLNDNELLDFVAWTKDVPVHVRFIEFMPFAGNRWISNKVFTWQQMLERISERYSFLPLKSDAHETAKAYGVPKHAGTFSVISTMSAPFCSSCNRIRLTADGKLKNCLFAREEADILSALRNGGDIEALIKKNIADKAPELGGQLNKNFEALKPDEVFNRSMIAIGG